MTLNTHFTSMRVLKSSRNLLKMLPAIANCLFFVFVFCRNHLMTAYYVFTRLFTYLSAAILTSSPPTDPQCNKCILQSNKLRRRTAKSKVVSMTMKKKRMAISMSIFFPLLSQMLIGYSSSHCEKDEDILMSPIYCAASCPLKSSLTFSKMKTDKISSVVVQNRANESDNTVIFISVRYRTGSIYKNLQ